MQDIHLMLVRKLKIKLFRIDLVWTLYQTCGYLRVANTKRSDIGLLCSEVTVLLETENGALHFQALEMGSILSWSRAT